MSRTELGDGAQAAITLSSTPQDLYECGEITIRLRNCLRSFGFVTLEDLLRDNRSFNELRKYRNFGGKSWHELNDIKYKYSYLLTGPKKQAEEEYPTYEDVKDAYKQYVDIRERYISLKIRQSYSDELIALEKRLAIDSLPNPNQ